jgi:hypothetical protein
MVQLKKMTTMKKIYKTPITEQVRVKLYNSVLGGVDITYDSKTVANDPLAKENNLIFDDEDEAFGDIWGTDEDPNDLWN